MWQRVAEELSVPWRAAEDMHWELGKENMAKRAGVKPFSRKDRQGSTTTPLQE